ncbi:unnamed protein product [Linum tenue]|uniref:Synergin gamma C-terminal domain-containing protein n=1 Tax=Linum tenue TaxID=586396 RepID=A0AAV0I2K9_9ROSI|nr:unnamed protein product [Linum tenue]
MCALPLTCALTENAVSNPQNQSIGKRERDGEADRENRAARGESHGKWRSTMTKTDNGEEEGFEEFITFEHPPPSPNPETVISEFLGTAAMASNFDDDDWGDFVNSSGGVLSQTTSLPQVLNHSDLFGIYNDGKRDDDAPPKQTEDQPGSAPGLMKSSGALPLSLFGEMEEDGGGAGEQKGSSVADFPPGENAESVKKTGNLDVNDLIANLYKPNGIGAGSVPASNGNLVGANPIGLDPSWSWGNASAMGNGASSIPKLASTDSDPLNLNSNGWRMSGNSGSVVQGSDLSSDAMSNGSNAANGNGGFDEEGDDDDGWEFKAAESKVEDNVKPEQMKNQNGPIFHRSELNSSWNEVNLDFSGWNTSANGVDQNGLNNGPVTERKELASNDAWEFVVAVAPDEKIKNVDSISEDVSKMNLKSSNLSWDPLQRPDSNGLASSLGGVNADVISVNPVLLDEIDGFANSDGWAFKKAELDLQDAAGKMENGPQMQSTIFDSSLNISDLDGGGGVNPNLFATDWNAKEEISDTKQLNPIVITETEDLEGEDDWEFKVAESESMSIDSSSKAIEIRHSDSQGALPLSLFGDEETEPNDPVFYEVTSVQISAPETREDNKGFSSGLSIHDLISSLYSEVEQTATVGHLQDQDENVWGPTGIALASNSSNDAASLDDDDAWEFKDASPVPMAEEQISFPKDPPIKASNIELSDWIDLFTKLKEELCLVAFQHLENMKQARGAAALAGEDAALSNMDKEIQDMHNGLLEYGTVPEVHSGDQLLCEIRTRELFELLLHPNFQVIESEYQLSEKLLKVQSDSNSTLLLLKKVVSVMKILTLLSRREQTSYVSTWSKMLYQCAEELKQGSMIWSHLLQENIQGQVLSSVEGKRYFLALGEIYRVSEVLRCTARLYKPWILLERTDSISFYSIMNECSALWSSSGLEEALLSISDGSVKALLESVQYLHNLEDDTLYEIVFAGQGYTCQLSGLNPGVVPGMETIVWNGSQYFVKLANLWANLISCDPPNMPRLHIG